MTGTLGSSEKTRPSARERDHSRHRSSNGPPDPDLASVLEHLRLEVSSPDQSAVTRRGRHGLLSLRRLLHRTGRSATAGSGRLDQEAAIGSKALITAAGS
jgi:hypothetical protein